MKKSAILAGALLLPLERVNVDHLMHELTVNYLPMGEVEPVIVEAFFMRRGYIGVPRQFGLSFAARMGIEVDDQTSEGQAVRFTPVDQPRPHQIPFIHDIVETSRDFYDFLARAHTGFGKTFCSLTVAARLGRTTLILVDQENLRDQWLTALEKHFGMTIANGAVGIIQGTKCDYLGKSVVIGMVQTVSQKKLPPAVYDYFGFLIVDEVHIIGAPTFSQPLMRFSATHRLGVSATPKRKDSLDKIMRHHLGAVRVAADKEHDTSAVYFAQHQTVYSWYANISPKIGRIITEVSEDGSRNLLLAEAIMWLYQTGRDTLVLSDRIEQLKHLMSMLYYLGVDPEVMGLYTGNNPTYKYAKDPKPKRKPPGVDADTQYSPVSLQLIAKAIPKKKLVQVKEQAALQFATYGMAAKGYDQPRLSAGVDASPRGAAEQIHGRILREVEGKKKPIWVTVEDVNNYRLEFSFASRARDYAKSNGRLYQWHDNGELEQCKIGDLMRDRLERVKYLKSLRIETNKDGRNMLVTVASVKKRAAQAVIDTVERIRSGKRN